MLLSCDIENRDTPNPNAVIIDINNNCFHCFTFSISSLFSVLSSFRAASCSSFSPLQNRRIPTANWNHLYIYSPFLPFSLNIFFVRRENDFSPSPYRSWSTFYSPLKKYDSKNHFVSDNLFVWFEEEKKLRTIPTAHDISSCWQMVSSIDFRCRADGIVFPAFFAP